MVRLAILLLSRRWGLIVVGAALIVGGLIWGITSHQVSYIQSSDTTTYHIGQGKTSGNVYINAQGSSEYYVAFSSDFKVSDSDLNSPGSVGFIARSDTSQLDPPLNASDGSTVHEAHKIEKLIFKDNSGKITGTYTTNEYSANPNGFYDNNWLKSIWLIIAGLIVGGLALVAPMLSKKTQPNAGFNIGAGGVQAYQQPQQPYAQPQQPYQQPYAQPPYQQPQQPYAQPQQPYQQPYQGPAQYPQGAPQPPQQSYGQPQPPYQQPPRQ